MGSFLELRISSMFELVSFKVNSYILCFKDQQDDMKLRHFNWVFIKNEGLGEC